MMLKGRPVCTAIILAFLSYSIVFVLWRIGCFTPAELWIYDAMVAARANPNAVEPRIVVVGIDEQAIRDYGYPLPDLKLAQMLNVIEQDQPCAIGLDLYRDLPEPRDGSGLNQLNEVLRKNPNIICIFKFGNETHPFLIPPPACLLNPPPSPDDPPRFGFNDFADYNIIRRSFLYLPDSCIYSSLDFILATNYLAGQGIGPQTAPDGFSTQLGKSIIRRFTANDGGYVNQGDADGYQFLLDYKGAQVFKDLTPEKVFAPAKRGTFTNKIVLIGMIADSTSDVMNTPVAKLSQGVFIHAQIINQLLRAAIDGDSPTTSWTFPQETLWLMGWCALAAFLGHFRLSYWAFGIAFISLIFTVFFVGWLSFYHGLWLPIATPTIGIILTALSIKGFAAHRESSERATLMSLFSQNVSNDVFLAIWERRDEFLDGNRPRAQRMTASILFSDIKDYSAITETMQPEVHIDWINEYLDTLGKPVKTNRGSINKFIGDSIMAVFGAPFPSTTEAGIRQDAINAVQCALDMREELKRLNAKWKEKGLPQAEMRVGIHTGPVMAGFVGPSHRLEYTLMGDTTNTASRLESVEKDNFRPDDQGCRVLVSEETLQYIKDCFVSEPMGTIKLKGQSKSTIIYRILRPVTRPTVNEKS